MKDNGFLKPAGAAIFKDRYTTKANELLVDYQSGRKGQFGLVGLPLSKTSISHSGASFAPEAIRASLSGFSIYSGEIGEDLPDHIIDFGDVLMHPTDIIESQRRITSEMEVMLDTKAAKNWLFLGGDHGVSYSIIKAIAKEQKVGILQFDAHHDVRNTTDGGPTNGTPFRRLIEDETLEGKQISQIGIRDFMNAKHYDQYAKENGIQVFTMQDVEQIGMKQLIKQELARLEQLTDCIYLSVDMDVLDQAFAPGCPAIGPGGMDSNTLIRGIGQAAKHPKVTAMDVVEIDPTLDFRNMTSKLAAYLILTFMKAKM